MDEFLAGGRAIVLVLSLIVAEAIVLMVLWRMRICPLPPRATLLILAPGTSLLLAALAALSGASWMFVSSLFFVALIIHLIDLRQRWRERAHLDASPGSDVD
jgi:tellurite resistance protein TehA-like permease